MISVIYVRGSAVIGGVRIGPNYSHSIGIGLSPCTIVAVGHPNRRYLWILARAPRLDPDLLASIKGRLAAQGYDITRLKPTPRATAPARTP